MTETPTTTAPPLPGLLYRQAAEYQARLEALDGQATAALRQTWAGVQAATTRDLDILLARIQQARTDGIPVSRGWLMREARYRELLVTADRELTRWADTSTAVTQSVQAGARDLATTSAGSLASAATTEAGITASLVEVNPDNLRHLVGFTQAGTPLADLFASLGPDALAGARDVLTRGIVQGTGIDRIRRELVQALDVPRWRAETIARTESHRVFRAASLETYRANSDVVGGWVWVANLDSRCCPACVVMDGTIHSLDEMLDGHARCRCAQVPRTKSWEELLGEAGRDVPDTRPPIRSGAAWLRGESAAVQRAVLGPGKYAAWKAGSLDLEDLVTRTESGAWGTSRREATLAEAIEHARARRREDERQVRNTRRRRV